MKGGAVGTASLFKNSMEGTLGFFQSISSSISKGVLLISDDKQYLSIREQNLLTEKPKNFVEGFGYGMYSGINSMVSGVTGVFT